jgi:LPS-assembly protein
LSTLPGFALVVLLLTASSAVADGLVLKKDVELMGSAVAGQAGPLFLSADLIESTAPNVIEASGQVEARQAGRNFFANWLRYDTTLNLVQARGQVRLEQSTLVVQGDSLELNLDTYGGELIQPVYLLPAQKARGHDQRFELADATSPPLPAPQGRGHAERIDFLDENHFSLQDATYTTCPINNDDWFLKVGDLDIDKTRNVGTAHHATLQFLGTPVLYTPWLDFSLNNERKSGVLAPTVGLTERSGVDVTVPYYLNLAPNYDATLFPRLLTKRGLLLGIESRFLLENSQGMNSFEVLPNDRVADDTRWSVALNDEYRLNANTRAGMTVIRVSDNDYFRDLSNRISVTSLTNLDAEAWVVTQHENWDAELRVQSFQTLQDSTAPPITPPYERLPFARLGYKQSLPSGIEFKLETQATRFVAPESGQPDGTRVMAYPTLQLPLVNSFGFLVPQVGWSSTYYALDEDMPKQTITRNLPILSLDSGLIFDRPFRFSGADYVQTLEPRAYYVYAPYRDQNAIPVFDTAQMEFGYAQMFTENQFVGYDRINDANQLTLAFSSRFIESSSGLERLMVTVGQRYYFTSQQVTLPGVAPRTGNTSDLLAAVSGQISRDWRYAANWQYDAQTHSTYRQNLGVSYHPGNGHALNFGYRFIDQSTNQIDVSGQWPLTQRMYGMFRYNYSFEDNKLIEGLAGLEYNGGCWSMRGVIQRLATKEDQSTDAFFLQLELNGMGRLGASPLEVLKHSVPGYRTTNEFLQTP